MPTTTVSESSSVSANLRSHILTAVRDRARSEPDRVALVADSARIGYAELWQRAHVVGRNLGRSPGVVGVRAVHEPSVVVEMLGVWLSGGTYCPIDPSFPPDHGATLLASVGGRPLTQEGRTTPTQGAGVTADVAYVLFTSGSTGTPRPVAVSHRALDVVVPALSDLFVVTPDDRVLQFASLNWDTAFEEILPALTRGASVVFGPEIHGGSLQRLLRFVERSAISILNLPTAMWHELVLHLAESGERLPESVRLVVIGGEAVNPSRLAAWREVPGTARIRLLNTYGATETTLITHAVDLHGPRASACASGGPPIGRPLAHVLTGLTDEGELIVGGPSLADGYPGFPRATEERFIDVAGARRFRTGDFVRVCPDGLTHHQGRRDAQVKVRGVRVDPGEVEAHLLGQPGVAAAAVLGVVRAGRTALAAYVVPTGQHHDDPRGELVASIRRRLREDTPRHLHPAHISIVPALVLTASGKVDRRATHDRFGATPEEAATTAHAGRATT